MPHMSDDQQRRRSLDERVAVIENKLTDLDTEVDRTRTRLHDVEKTYTTVALVTQHVANLESQMKGMRGEMGGVRRALLGFAMTVAGGMTLFAFTIFTVFK